MTFIQMYPVLLLAFLACANTNHVPKPPQVTTDAELMSELELNQQEPVVTKPVRKPIKESPTLYDCPEQIPEAFIEDRRAKRDTIVVFKSSFRLGLYRRGMLRKINTERPCFSVAMGRNPRGAKTMMDWKSTPEGWYKVWSRRGLGATSFHRAFHVSYPNQNDVHTTHKEGVIDAKLRNRFLRTLRRGGLPSQRSPMGGWIMIHGEGSTPRNWTAGCIAMNNADIDTIFPYVRRRTSILIIPWKQRLTHTERGGTQLLTKP